MASLPTDGSDNNTQLSVAEFRQLFPVKSYEQTQHIEITGANYMEATIVAAVEHHLKMKFGYFRQYPSPDAFCQDQVFGLLEKFEPGTPNYTAIRKHMATIHIDHHSEGTEVDDAQHKLDIYGMIAYDVKARKIATDFAARKTNPRPTVYNYGEHVTASTTYGIACEALGLLDVEDAMYIKERGGRVYYIDAPKWAEGDNIGILTSDYFCGRDLIKFLRIMYGN